jgi:hypothetical protein
MRDGSQLAGELIEQSDTLTLSSIAVAASAGIWPFCDSAEVRLPSAATICPGAVMQHRTATSPGSEHLQTVLLATKFGKSRTRRSESVPSRSVLVSP